MKKGVPLFIKKQGVLFCGRVGQETNKGKIGRKLAIVFLPSGGKFRPGVMARVISKSNECEERGRFEITSTISSCFVRKEVQLLINHIYSKFRN